MNITRDQCKMARSALNWGIRDLAEKANVGVSTVTRFENGQAVPIASTLAAMQRTFEAAGVEFLPDNGVRLRRSPGTP